MELIGNSESNILLGNFISDGTFGQIYKCYMRMPDGSEGTEPKVLKLCLPGDNMSVTCETLHEVAMLKKLQGIHESIISIDSVMTYILRGQLYVGILMPFYEHDLYSVISKYQSDIFFFNVTHIKYNL